MKSLYEIGSPMPLPLHIIFQKEREKSCQQKTFF